LADLGSSLQKIYATSKACQKSKCYVLEPEITRIFAQSRDYDQLFDIWKSWHENTGPKMKNLFIKIVESHNKGAKNNGFKDMSEFWINDFEDDHFEEKYDKLFNEIKPLYDQLHLYVKNKLKNFYGIKYQSNQYIPAHLLGNLWAQDWENIRDIVLPYQNENIIDLTAILIKKNFSEEKIFKVNVISLQ
jgi:peptidyl-dipeptidase A